MSNKTILYSFRRCPYAIRARLAIAQANIQLELREILLKDKPKAMLNASPKGTVPVLVLDDNRVIDESLDIMFWAFEQNDPKSQFKLLNERQRTLIEKNDQRFKYWLDRYKYSDRHPEQSCEEYRNKACEFINELEELLAKQNFLGQSSDNNTPGFADLAIYPFVRQFAFCDITWFKNSRFINTQKWLNDFLNSHLFQQVMPKYPQWQDHEKGIMFP